MITTTLRKLPWHKIDSSHCLYKRVNGSIDGDQVKLFASAGNRTRAARVAGEHSTTEPPMHTLVSKSNVGFELV